MKLKKFYKIKGSLIHCLYNFFLILFLFTTFNREFTIGSFDLRYIGFFMEIVLLICQFYVEKGKIYITKEEQKLLLFYGILFISNISWFGNQIKFNAAVVVNVWILNAYNFLALFVFLIFKRKTDKKVVYKTIIASNVILAISILWIYFEGELPDFFVNDARTITLDTGNGEHSNILGQGIRIAGFAEDANYAALFMMVAIATVLMHVKKKRNRILLMILFLMAEGLAFSRTVILAGVIAAMFFVLRITMKKGTRMFDMLLVYGIFGICMVLPFFKYENILNTVSTRFAMWEKAADLFKKNVIIGNGLGSFRCYNSSFYHNNWYVQCHSTWWQILSENGLFAIILFLTYIQRRLDMCKDNNYKRFLLILYIIFASTYETIYLQVFILIIYLLQEIRDEEVSK